MVRAAKMGHYSGGGITPGDLLCLVIAVEKTPQAS